MHIYLQLLQLQNFQQSQGCSSLKHPTNNQCGLVKVLQAQGWLVFDLLG
jgi:hypothetical protein